MVRTKRISAPLSCPTTRKAGGRFAITPRPGPHSTGECAPLGSVIRDALGLADNMREVRTALNAGKISVNGIVRKDHKFPVGIFDVVGAGEEHYRCVPTARGLSFVKIQKKEAGTKMCRVENKTLVRGGRVQINLSDGTNLLMDKTEYKTGDTLVLKLPDLKVGSHLRRAKGALCVLTRGRNVGRLATLENVNLVRGTGTNTVTLKIDNTTVQVPVEMVFVVGEKEPVITVQK